MDLFIIQKEVEFVGSVERFIRMLMKWSDLEIGDRVKIHPETLKYWRTRGYFLEKRFEKSYVISKIDIYKEYNYEYISIKIESLKGLGIVRIFSTTGYESNSAIDFPFFEVVKVRKD